MDHGWRDGGVFRTAAAVGLRLEGLGLGLGCWIGFGLVLVWFWFGYRLRTFSAMVGQLQSQPEVDDVQNENVSGWEEEGSKRSARHHSQI